MQPIVQNQTLIQKEIHGLKITQDVLGSWYIYHIYSCAPEY